MQYAWIRSARGHERRSFVVGDDDQSIYACAARTSSNMHEFERESTFRNMIKLEQNYRSHGHILEGRQLTDRQQFAASGQNLRTDGGHGEPMRVYEAATNTQEAGLDRRGDQGD